jgi:negative regulator of replication initiation
VEQQSRATASAANTAIVLLDAWIAGDAPSHYAASALQSMGETLSESTRRLSETQFPETGKRAATDLAAAAKAAETAVKNDNRPKAAEARDELREALARLPAADTTPQVPN